MSDIANPHDAFFHETLSRRETAISFVREQLPAAVVDCLDVDSLEIGRDSFIEPELRGHFSDFICRARLLDSGGDAYVYILVEHKTTPERLVAFQVLRYLTQIWHAHVTQGGGFPLPPVIPVVFYHGRRPWTVSTEFSALFRSPEPLEPFVPHFRYHLADLTRLADDEIRGIELLLAPLLAMRHIHDDDLLERVPGILRVLAAVVHTRPGLDALDALLSYFKSTDRVLDHELERAVTKAFPGAEGESIMGTFASRWIQQGLQEGLQRAAATARENVLEVLETRFHSVPQGLRTRVERIEDVSALRKLHRTALTAASLEDFQHELETSYSRASPAGGDDLSDDRVGSATAGG